jgi:hypothetical protein
MRLLAGFLLLVAFARAASDISLRVGAARADITPEPEVLNWVTGKPYGAVLDPLYVQALVLDDGRTKAVLLRWDLVDVSESARDEVRRAIGEALAIPPANILVHASHTHSAPWAPVYGDNHRGRERDTWWAIRHIPPQNEHPPFQRWMRRLIEASVAAAQRAADSAQPVTLWIGRISVAEFLHNRRPRAPAWGLAEPEAQARVGAEAVAAEIQVIACGPLALVGLPGEPMTEIGQAIREQSPFPQTLVLGYANGNGVHYVGMPGEKARGGYEGGLAGAGTDACGPLMIDAAMRVLRELRARSPTAETR